MKRLSRRGARAANRTSAEPGNQIHGNKYVDAVNSLAAEVAHKSAGSSLAGAAALLLQSRSFQNVFLKHEAQRAADGVRYLVERCDVEQAAIWLEALRMTIARDIEYAQQAGSGEAHDVR